jgi:NADH-ubiquinone oxidoreductase chain 6
MITLYTLNETITNGYSTLILDLLSLVSILCAMSVILSKNPIISVLFLIGLFLSIASYLIIIGISFIGLSYLLVYVGAVSILFLFILMLINVRVSELLNETSNSIPLVFIIAFSLNSILSKLLPENIYSLINNKISFNNYSDYLNKLHIYNNEDKVSFVTVNTWDNNLAEINHITSIGNIIYTNYSIWLILTSIILLLAMVGAIVITIKQKNS